MTKIQIDVVLLCHETKNIMIMYKSILRPCLFRMDAEKIHGQIVALLHVYRHFPPVKCLLRAFYRPKATPFQWRNLTFANRVSTILSMTSSLLQKLRYPHASR